MDTLRLKNTPEDLQTAAKIILEGGIVAIPTDTLYGLAALDDEAVARVKGRTLNEKPISWLVNKIPADFSNDNRKLAENYWPGALTIIDKGIGYRQSDDLISKTIIDLLGSPITGTSANLTEHSASTKADKVLEQLDGLINAIVIDDSVPQGKASTVVLDGQIIRQGAIKIQ